MKAAALIAFLLASASSASALIYQGEITYTITRVGTYSTGLQIGDTFNGSYSYESDTIDGLFSRGEGSQAGDPNLLSMSVYLPLDFCPAEAGGGDYMSLPGNSRMQATDCWMQVVGGVVTGFNWGPEYGEWAMTLTSTYFAAWKMMGEDGAVSNKATVQFSRPTVASVPDAGATLALLTSALGALLIGRRRVEN